MPSIPFERPKLEGLVLSSRDGREHQLAYEDNE